MNILSIETSCDETSIALIKTTKTDTGIGVDVLAHIVHSQADLHAEYGGVFPALAKREHGINLVPVMLKVIEEVRQKEPTLFKTDTNATDKKQEEIKNILEREPDLYTHIVRHLLNISAEGIDAIAVTAGPGLEPALWVGINFARSLGVLWDIPVMPVNHMEGHLISALFDENTKQIRTPVFPMTTLLVSGGHTELIQMDSWGSYRIIGKTRDDAVGEAYDKTARLLGLPYPGGPEISKLASHARKENIASPVTLPRPMIKTSDLDFSFSGLKTAVLYAVRDGQFTEDQKAGLTREFDEAIADVLTYKLSLALTEHNSRTCSFGGGVMASTYLRERLIAAVKAIDSEMPTYLPPSYLATDNALMIALALSVRLTYTQQEFPHADQQDIKALGNLTF